MSRILLAPSRYVQGAGAINEVGLHAARLGTRVFVIGGKTALSICAENIAQSLNKKGLACSQEQLGGVS